VETASSESPHGWRGSRQLLLSPAPAIARVPRELDVVWCAGSAWARRGRVPLFWSSRRRPVEGDHPALVRLAELVRSSTWAGPIDSVRVVAVRVPWFDGGWVAGSGKRDSAPQRTRILVGHAACVIGAGKQMSANVILLSPHNDGPPRFRSRSRCFGHRPLVITVCVAGARSATRAAPEPR